MTRSDVRLVIAIVSAAVVAAGGTALVSRRLAPAPPDLAPLERRLELVEHTLATEKLEIDEALRRGEPDEWLQLDKRDPGQPDQIDRAMIRDGVAAVRGRVAACGDKSNAKGLVRVHVKVQPDGKVSSVVLDRTPETSLGACVAAAIQRATFTATRDGGAFSYPFVF